MAYGYYFMPTSACYYCPYDTRRDFDQSTELKDEQLLDKENTYYRSQYRILPLITIPLLFAAFAPRPIWGPPPFYYNYYWYYYR